MPEENAPNNNNITSDENKGKEIAANFSSNKTTINIPSPVSVVVHIPDNVSLLHRRDIETGSFDTEPPEGQGTSFGVRNDDSGVSSQPSQQPSPPAESSVAQNPDLETEFKVATLVTMISSGAIVGALSGLVGNKKAHKNLVMAFSVLNYASLVLGVGLFVLTLTRPNIPSLVKITRFIMWIAIGSTTYALGCATSLLLPKLAEVVIVLVVPFVMVCLIAALSYGGWRFGTSNHSVILD